MVVAVMTFTIFAEVRCALSARASPLRLPFTVTDCVFLPKDRTAFKATVCPGLMMTVDVDFSKPT